MKHLIFLLILVFGLSACNTSTTSSSSGSSSTTIYVTCSTEQQASGTCVRFMDRKIYFAQTDASTSLTKNNAFQKLIIQEALTELAEKTNLGENYFTYSETDQSNIQPITSAQVSSDFKSFIQVWPDSEFNAFVTASITSGSIPDPNAILVVNSANKKQFYIIFRASCFEASNTTCTNEAGVTMTENGMKALVARQLGLLVGLTTTDCSDVNNTMCADYPRDTQWNTTNKNYFANSFNNALETISQNPDFYSVYSVSSDSE